MFTCMTTRAIHLEITHKLDTSSFILYFIRLLRYHGYPVHTMYSDNGTNFRRADKALRNIIQQLDKDQIHFAVRRKGVNWVFNPPSASSQGGAWKRQIRRVRKIMSSMENDPQIRTSNDKALLTVFSEVEYMINSRPIRS